MAGLIGLGQDTKESAKAGLSKVAALESQRNLANKNLEAAERSQKASMAGGGAATGAMIGAQYGTAGGPWGIAVGAVVGAAAGLLGAELF